MYQTTSSTEYTIPLSELCTVFFFYISHKEIPLGFVDVLHSMYYINRNKNPEQEASCSSLLYATSLTPKGKKCLNQLQVSIAFSKSTIFNYEGQMKANGSRPKLKIVGIGIFLTLK